VPHNRPFDILLEDELDEVLEREAEKSDDDDTDDSDVDTFEGVSLLGDNVTKMWKDHAKIETS
jgi:hypothetical protein